MAKKKKEVSKQENEQAEEALSRLMTLWGEPDRGFAIGTAVACWEAVLTGSAQWVEKFFTSAEWVKLAESIDGHHNFDEFAEEFRKEHPDSIRLSRKLESIDEVSWRVILACCAWLKENEAESAKPWWKLEHRKAVEAAKK